MAGREAVIVQVGVDDRGREMFGQSLQLANALGDGNAATGDDY
jgi:hypothetical protein